MHFFLGSENDDGEDSEDEDEVANARRDVKKMEHGMKVTKSARKKERALREAKKETRKVSVTATDLWKTLLMPETPS